MTRTNGGAGRTRASSGATVALVAALVAPWMAPAALAGQLPDSTAAAGPDSTVTADTLFMDWAAPLPASALATFDYVVAASPDTPGGMGLLETGRAEARIALEHVQLAGRDSMSLSSMTRHAPHVIHAIDPAEAGDGPGMGYGVRRAARSMQNRLEELSRMEGLPGALRFHVPFALQAARGAEARASEAIAVARALQRATSAAEGRRLVQRLDEAVRAMAYGSDRDDDGRIGYTEDESGLAQIEYHLNLVRRVSQR